MQSMCKGAALAAMSLLLMPQLVGAAEGDERMQQMEERIGQMEKRLQQADQELAAANAKIDSQQDAVAAAAAAAAAQSEASSGISDFISKTEIDAWLAVSYNYNFNGSEDARLAAGGQNGLAHHPNPNTFQADQFWIAIDKAPSEESRGGFHVDLAAGFAADVPGYAPNIYSASVSYLAPIGNGVTIAAGQLPTLLGGEVTQTNANYNITRGLVWGMQPTTNLGGVASTSFGENLGIAIGMLNSPISNDVGSGGFDRNSGKALTSQISYSAEKYSAAVGLNWGREALPASSAGTSNHYTGLLDVLLTVDPLENLSAWINYDYKFEDENLTGGRTGMVKTHGLALATRLGVLETTGFALRFEYLRRDGSEVGEGTSKRYEFTGTFDHALTDHLTFKAEARWDRSEPDAFLAGGSGNSTIPTKRSQVLLLGQLMYDF